MPRSASCHSQFATARAVALVPTARDTPGIAGSKKGKKGKEMQKALFAFLCPSCFLYRYSKMNSQRKYSAPYFSKTMPKPGAAASQSARLDTGVCFVDVGFSIPGGNSL
jgi:hypothetical protein